PGPKHGGEDIAHHERPEDFAKPAATAGMLECKVAKSNLAGKGVVPEEGIVPEEGVLALTEAASVEGVHRAPAGRGRLAVKGPAGRRGADTAHAGKPVDAADVATRKGALSR